MHSCSLSDLPSLDEEVYPFVALVCVLYLTFFGALSGHNFLWLSNFFGNCQQFLWKLPVVWCLSVVFIVYGKLTIGCWESQDSFLILCSLMDYQLGQRENEKENLASLPGFISKIFQNACVSWVSQRGFPSHPGQKKIHTQRRCAAASARHGFLSGGWNSATADAWMTTGPTIDNDDTSVISYDIIYSPDIYIYKKYVLSLIVFTPSIIIYISI